MQILSFKILNKTSCCEIWTLLLLLVWIYFDYVSVRVQCVSFMQVKIELITCPHSDINSSFVLVGHRI